MKCFLCIKLILEEQWAAPDLSQCLGQGPVTHQEINFIFKWICQFKLSICWESHKNFFFFQTCYLFSFYPVVSHLVPATIPPPYAIIRISLSATKLLNPSALTAETVIQRFFMVARKCCICHVALCCTLRCKAFFPCIWTVVWIIIKTKLYCSWLVGFGSLRPLERKLSFSQRLARSFWCGNMPIACDDGNMPTACGDAIN